MAGASRWADTEEDAALDARRRKEKEDKKQQKAEKARMAKLAEDTKAATGRTSGAGRGEDEGDRPAKRRRVTPDRGEQAPDDARLLRFPDRPWKQCRSVERYSKLNDIEEGTYGWVSRAKDTTTGTVVALKRLKAEPSDRNGLPVTGLREIQVLKDCNHDNIVKLREVVVGDDTSKIESIFLVLEFVEHDLKSVLDDMPEPFLLSEVKRLMLQLTQGVAYLHDNWILHRDLKTSNLLLNNRGQLKIADFGMARYVGDPAPKLTQLVVTLWYRSPELLLGTKVYNGAVDMWSIGCIFGEILTREPLLQGANEVEQVTKIFELCGVPSQSSWPTFRSLPNARTLRLPKPTSTAETGSIVRAKFTSLTNAGVALLNDLLALDPERRPTAKEMLSHKYFAEDPKPKPESLFPTFPSRAGQERRRRHEPHAPGRDQQAATLGDADLSGIFQGRESEVRGGGFQLRVV
ncbi:serine/threonine-protein kinase ppk23, partial [Plectosphaerella plurivora]